MRDQECCLQQPTCTKPRCTQKHADVHDLEIYDTGVCLFVGKIVLRSVKSPVLIWDINGRFCRRFFVDGCRQIKQDRQRNADAIK